MKSSCAHGINAGPVKKKYLVNVAIQVKVHKSKSFESVLSFSFVDWMSLASGSVNKKFLCNSNVIMKSLYLSLVSSYKFCTVKCIETQ